MLIPKFSLRFGVVRPALSKTFFGIVLLFLSSHSSAQSIFTVAGGGNSSGDGGPATAAFLNMPRGVAVDSAGNLYIADTFNHRIRKVSAATRIITTVAGSGSEGFSGDGGPATAASLAGPIGIALDSSGNIYVSDALNNRIRKVTAATGIITTVAGSTSGFSGDGGPATAASLDLPWGIALDSSGNLYIADTGNNRIRLLNAATRVISTAAGGGQPGLPNFLGDGGPATAASLDSPEGLALDGSGNIYIADTFHSRIRKVTVATGIITTVAGSTQGFSGDGGPATAASLSNAAGVALDGSGNLYIADTENNRIRKLTAATGIMTTVAGNGTPGYSGDGGPATAASLYFPEGVAVDSSGNLYIADFLNSRIRGVLAPSRRRVVRRGE